MTCVLEIQVSRLYAYLDSVNGTVQLSL